MKSHKGFITLYSEVGRGTSFKLYLPAAPSEQLQQQAKTRSTPPGGNGEVVLIIDDEAPVREITRATLESFGYAVLTAVDGADGVAVFAQHLQEIQLVISDMDMPVMGGAAMIRSLQAINPQIRIISATGLPRNEHATLPAANPKQRRFLPKPFTAEQLLLYFRQCTKCCTLHPRDDSGMPGGTATNCQHPYSTIFSGQRSVT